MKTSFPPLKPEEKIKPLFSLLEEKLMDLEEQHKHEKKVEQLKKIQKKLYVLLAVLQTINTAIVSGEFKIDEEFPKKIQKELFVLFELMMDLDRHHYQGFYKKIKNMNQKLMRRVIELDNQLIHEISHQIQTQRIPRQSTKVVSPPSLLRISLNQPRVQINQLLGSQP